MGKSLCLLVALAVVGMSAKAAALEVSSVIVLGEPGFPAVDSAAPTNLQLQKLLPQARLARAAELPDLLARHGTRLLVLPYGSAFPEQAWPAIHHYLQRGGNLLVVGGRPFTRAALRDDKGWHLRPDSVRFTRPLMIDQYQPTPGSQGLQFLLNPDVPVKLPAFDWVRAYGLVIRLSAVDLYKRGGSAGALDARLDTLAWGSKDGIKLAAPVVQIDHLHNGFEGGRWIFVNAELTPDFWSGANADMVGLLAAQASEGVDSFTVRPHLPLYQTGEDIALDVACRKADHGHHRTVRITLFPEAQPAQRTVLSEVAATAKVIKMPAPAAPGLYGIEAALMEDGATRATYRSGFWMRDQAYLRSGPRLSVGGDYFELDGKPLAVLGTTHMSSEVQRQFFAQPNVAVWERDLAHIRAAGLNMIRTGWWTGWDTICDGEGTPSERALRTLEAYLMTARKHGLPVQFNFFAFVPDVLGGKNPYLDPEAVRRQKELVSKVVAHFREVPFVAWDLINEPSFSTRLWMMRPNGDALEKTAWNAWLDRRYPDKAVLAELWNAPQVAIEGPVPPPSDAEFWSRGVYAGHNPLRVYDYFQFAQESFAAWTGGLRDAIRATGSRQLITVGQDEGGVQDRLSPAYWSRATDFTTNHSWWQNDALLWDSLAAKQPGQPMLIQETGLQRELYPDEKARRTLDSEAALLERKVALSFVRGAGAIQWLWHANSYMTDGNETPIGAVRPDGTEKPEAAVLRKLAPFATALSPYLRDLAPPAVAVGHVAGGTVLGAGRAAARGTTESGARARLPRTHRARHHRGKSPGRHARRRPGRRRTGSPALAAGTHRPGVAQPASLRGPGWNAAGHRRRRAGRTLAHPRARKRAWPCSDGAASHLPPVRAGAAGGAPDHVVVRASQAECPGHPRLPRRHGFPRNPARQGAHLLDSRSRRACRGHATGGRALPTRAYPRGHLRALRAEPHPVARRPGLPHPAWPQRPLRLRVGGCPRSHPCSHRQTHWGAHHPRPARRTRRHGHRGRDQTKGRGDLWLLDRVRRASWRRDFRDASQFAGTP
jgi:hypothetical protein